MRTKHSIGERLLQPSLSAWMLWLALMSVVVVSFGASPCCAANTAANVHFKRGLELSLQK